MGVIKPGYHLKAAHDLPQLRKKLRGEHSTRGVNAELSLTSMIDMFSMLIIFLIQSFSAQGVIFQVNKDLSLPVASYGKVLERAPIITVFIDKVILEGIGVGDNANINEKIEEADWDLPLLTGKLDEYKRFFESIHTGAKFPGEVIVQADHNLPFVYLKRVMYSLAKVGYTNINLAVRGEAKGGTAFNRNAPAETVTQ